MSVFFFLALIVLIVVITLFISKTIALEKKVLDLEAAIRQLRNILSPARIDATSREARAIKIEPEGTATQSGAQTTEAPAPSLPSAGPEQPPGAEIPAAPPRPSRTREEWEALIGGKLLNRIGALALIIGIGFFLKYAFERDWISETVRVFIGFAAGGGLIFGGQHSHKKGLQVFAQGIIGAGIAVLYLTVYASFNFYHIVPMWIALLMMFVVTALTFLQALKYDSLAVSCLGWAGGFLTPIMLSTFQTNEAGLFTYVVILDIGLIAILLKKDKWVILEPLTLAATYLTYLIWHGKFYVTGALFITVFFLTIFWVLFHGLDIYRNLKRTTTYIKTRHIVAAFNAAFYYAAIYNLVNPPYHKWMGLVTLVIGAFYFLTFLALRKRQNIATAIFGRYVLTAVILLVIATAIQFTAYNTITFWSLEALVLAWWGICWKHRYLWKTALGLTVLAAFGLLLAQGTFAYFPIEDFTLLLNRRAIAFAVLAGSLGACTFLFKGVDKKSSELIRPILHIGWCILIFTLLTVESNDYFRKSIMAATGETASALQFTRFMTWTAIWLFYSLPLAWFGLRRGLLPMLFCGLVAMGLAIIMIAIQGFAFEPIERFHALLNIRAILFVLVIAGAFILMRWTKGKREDWPWLGYAAGFLQIAIVVLILDLLTGETIDLFKRPIFYLNEPGYNAGAYNEIARLKNLQQMALSGVWLLYSLALMVAGLWRRIQGLRIMAIVLFGITILKIFIYDLSFLETLYRIFSFIGLGVILLGVSYLYQRYKAIIFNSHRAEG